MEVEDAEDYGALYGGGRVLLSIDGGHRGSIRRFLLDGLGFAQARPTPIHEDNSACIEWGNNVIGGRERAKHIDIRKHFAHEVIQNGVMRLIKDPTSAQLADILTKGLHFPQVQICVEGILGREKI